MEIRVTIAPDGKATTIESISALEDLWHDYVYFKSRAKELDQPSPNPKDGLLAKRYYRVALLSLVCYFEGVLNRWLQALLADAEWHNAERQHIQRKVELVQARTVGASGPAPEITAAKRLRNTLVHLKPGSDGELYDRINSDLLSDTEKKIDDWLRAVEDSSNLRRHPDTRAESRKLSGALGTSISEGYTADSE